MTDEENKLLKKEKVAAYNKAYNEKNKEILREKRKAKYWENPDLAREKATDFYWRNRESVLAKGHDWKEANKDRVQKYNVQYRSDNPDLYSRLARQRIQRNSERTSEQVEQDCAALHPDGVKRCSSCRVWQPTEKFYKNRTTNDGRDSRCTDCYIYKLRENANFVTRGLLVCVYCGGPDKHVDHVWPKSKGGTNDWWNLVPSCANCNSKKHDKNPWEWLSIALPDHNPETLFSSWGIDWSAWPKNVR